jgi:uncharacterized protein
VQKVRGWSEVVKQLWDEDTASGTPLRVMLLGSAPLLVRQGLTESLAGRFEIIRVTHWTFAEMRDAFDWDLETYIFHGGYPGAAALVKSHERWEEYILDSIVETNLSRDILLLNRVEKPGLLRQLFRLACMSSGRVVSYTKMLGSLADAGNTVTLAHYLELLGGAGMVAGLAKYDGTTVRRRGSSPKLLALNTALVSAMSRATLARTRADAMAWDRLALTAVGAHLWAHADPEDLGWWRDGNDEVDWVVRPGKLLRSRDDPVALEVRTAPGDRSRGSAAFHRANPGSRTLIVGEGGIPLEDFLSAHPREWLDG